MVYALLYSEPGLWWVHISLLAGEVSYLCSKWSWAQLSRFLPTLCRSLTNIERSTQAWTPWYFPCNI